MVSNVSEELRRLVDEAGGTEIFAVSIKVSASTVRRWIDQKPHPTILEMQRLERELDDFNVTITFNSKSPNE
jgi:hypothetical protein